MPSTSATFAAADGHGIGSGRHPWKRPSVDSFMAAEAGDHHRGLWDAELEMRRRRAETVVGQWAAEDAAAPSTASASGRPRRRSASECSTQAPTAGTSGSAPGTSSHGSASSNDSAKMLEPQAVAELRRRQAEQARLLLAQEAQHREQEERTLRLLQEQAEELQRQQAEEVEQAADELWRRCAEEASGAGHWQGTAEKEKENRVWPEPTSPLSDEIFKRGRPTKEEEPLLPPLPRRGPVAPPAELQRRRGEAGMRSEDRGRQRRDDERRPRRSQGFYGNADDAARLQAEEHWRRQRAKEREEEAAEERRRRHSAQSTGMDAEEDDDEKKQQVEQRRQQHAWELEKERLRQLAVEELRRQQAQAAAAEEERLRWQQAEAEAEEAARQEASFEARLDPAEAAEAAETDNLHWQRVEPEEAARQEAGFEPRLEPTAEAPPPPAASPSPERGGADEPLRGTSTAAAPEQDEDYARGDHDPTATAGKGTIPESPEPTAGQSLYDILGIGRESTLEDVRKAYKRQCMIHHPDKGGARERFEEVGRAYQILSDKALRRTYDHRGMEGVEQLRAREKTAAGEGATSATTAGTEKAQPIVVEAQVPLEVAYTGGRVEVQVVRIAACAQCQGKGTAPGACYIHCPQCDGQGAVPQYVQLGPMIIEQRVACHLCNGQGMVLPTSSLCSACNGEQLAEEEVLVPFEIPPGVAERERLVARGQGHTLPGLAYGDVVLVCHMQEHHHFFRKGDDLLAEHRVPLQQAICGGTFEVPHLNSHSVKVRVPRGVVLAPGTVKCVPGEGMPKRQNPHLRGDLVLRFDVEFPEALHEATAADLEAAFTGRGSSASKSAAGCSPGSADDLPAVPQTPGFKDGEVYLADFDMEQFGKTLEQAVGEAYDEDEEEAKARAAAQAAAAQGGRYHHSHPPFGFGGHFGGVSSPGGSIPCRQM